MKDRPDLFPDLIQDFETFWEMSEARQRSEMGIGPITTSEIVAHLDLWKINDLGARVTFANRIRIMDRTYRKIIAQKQKK
jgi:hypothetical protein